MTQHDVTAYLFSTLLIVAGCVVLLINLEEANNKELISTFTENPAVAIPELAVAGPEDQTRYKPLDERPLFVATRRALPVQIPVDNIAPVVQSMPLSINLLGILGAGKEKIVLVKQANSLEATSLRHGEEVNGWSVEEIKNDAAVFRSGEAKQILYLPDNRKVELEK